MVVCSIDGGIPLITYSYRVHISKLQLNNIQSICLLYCPHCLLIALKLFSFYFKMHLSGADPGFGIRGGGVSRRGIWGPIKVPSGSRWAKPLPPKLWGFEELPTFI
jgi:hypothetical protein